MSSEVPRTAGKPDVAPALVLMGSVFLGPTAWEPVGTRLAGLGWEVIVSPALDVRPPRSAEQAAALYVASVPPDRPVVLVPHSNAGNFVAVLSAMRNVAGVVFVDAVIPVESGIQPLAPAAFLAELETLAGEDGSLPPWTGWFPPEEVEALFPDQETRNRIEAHQPRVPISYLRDHLDIAAGWDTIPAAYLAFGDTYGPELQRARDRGWPVTILEGHHLHMLMDPDRVASEILNFVEPRG